MKKSTIKDIFQGEYIQCWEDEDTKFITFYQNGLTIAVKGEDYKALLKELKKLK